MKTLVLLLSALAVPLLSVAATAQDLDPVRVEKRVGKLESEMRAVQRKVFPGGDPKYFEPEIAAPVAAPPAAIGNPASQPLVDLAERVGQIEAQLRTLTGQVEANQFKVRQIEEAQTKLRGDLEFRLNALEGNAAPAGNAAAPAAAGNAAAATATPPRPGARPTAAPVAAVPATATAAWTAAYADVVAKDWPGTETAMTDFLAAWPKSPRVPQARYWLGKSYAERAQHAEAARAYLELYKTSPRDPRAQDALIGLAGAMQGLKKPKDACRVLGELDAVYGAKLTPAQKADAKALRAKAKCAA